MLAGRVHRGHDWRAVSTAWAASPRNSAMPSSDSGSARAASSAFLAGITGWSDANHTRPAAAGGVHEPHQRRVHVGGEVGRRHQVQLRPLEHVLDQQRLVGVAHVGADDGEAGEVDEHVLEQHRVLAAGAHLRAGDADVDRHRDAELLARGVHGVVEAVVQLVLLDERRDPHQRQRVVLGQLAHARRS